MGEAESEVRLTRPMEGVENQDLTCPAGKAHLVGAGWSRHLMGGVTCGVAEQGG
jgi:hypothetical protein